MTKDEALKDFKTDYPNLYKHNWDSQRKFKVTNGHITFITTSQENAEEFASKRNMMIEVLDD